MEELEIYGSRNAICPLSGESYYKRASNMLGIETPRPKQAVTKTWTAATQALYVLPTRISPSYIVTMLIWLCVTGPRKTISLLRC